jgi:pimeloyl-ACP methyl ester carboxylesterase
LQGLHALSSVKGLFLTGTPPLRSITDIQIAFQPEASGLLFKPEWNMEELMELSKLFTNKNPEIISNAMKRCDLGFKSDFLLPAFLDGFVNEHHVLAHTKIPICITWTKDDPFVNTGYIHDHIVTIDNKYLQFHEFNNGGHLPFIDNSPKFYNAMCDFLSSYDN